MKVNGNTQGIKQTMLDDMEKIYDMQVPTDAFISYDLMFLLGSLSAAINREISVYLSRQGKVLDVTIGSAGDVSLPFLRVRRGVSGLSGVRCVHTHPGGSPMLSSVDQGTLISSRLDAMSAIGINASGRVTGLSAAVIGENLTTPKILGPFGIGQIPLRGLMEEIYLATNRVRNAIALSETKGQIEKAVLVGVNASEQSMLELSRLAKTAGADVIGQFTKKRPQRDRKHYVGKGNLHELSLILNANNADMVITNDELSPAEQMKLEETLFVKVVDRATLILDIFASHATTKEGVLQVELAQLKYGLSRLAGQTVGLSRLGGGIGTRGPGESKLETDRRRINRRIFELSSEIEKLKSQRKIRRQTREKSGLTTVALAGYTNAGKSTLLNLLSGAHVLAEDKLFATLDPVTRKVAMPSGKTVLFSDTVGFIDKLPHDLIAAFQGTLEETALADLVLCVIDASDPDFLNQRNIVRDVLFSLGVAEDKILEVYNKADAIDFDPVLDTGRFYISAKTGRGIDELLNEIERLLKPALVKAALSIPYTRGDVLNFLQNICENPTIEYLDDTTTFSGYIKPEHLNKAKAMLNKLD